MIGMRIKKQNIIESKKRKSRGSRITTNTYFTRLQQAFKQQCFHVRDYLEVPVKIYFPSQYNNTRLG